MQEAKLFTGQSMLVDDADSLGLIVNGIFEPEETYSILGLVRSGDRVLDIGANVGYYTVLLAERVQSAGRIFAVEPNEANLQILDVNTRGWQIAERVQLFSCALSDAAGSANLFLSSHNGGMHRMYSSVVCTDESVPVSVVRGDDLGLAPLDFIKIDIEGFEPRAFRGLQQTLQDSPHVKILSEFSPFSILESGDSPRDWLQWMQDLGFFPLALRDGRWSSDACTGLLDSVDKLEQLDFSSLIGSLKGLDNPTILDRVIQAGLIAGYERPIIENLFFARPPEIASIETLVMR